MIFRSIDPASDTLLWEGEAADAATCAAAVTRARAAFPAWAALSQSEREDHVRRYKALLSDRSAAFAKAIARETGKPLWEAKTEIASMIGKVDISIAAQAERAGSREQATPFGRAVLRHKPHGVMAVLGPYNFPGHLPNGHIVPALLAGDVVIFKPSELTPLVGELMAQAFRDAGLPDGVFTLLQGGRDTGAALIAQDIDGLLFTGSAAAGAHFSRVMADRPGVILALELGGNNPLVAWDGDAQAVASIIVQSAFITAGQRCSCARRLIVPQGAAGDAILDATVALARRLTIGAWDSQPEPYMGALISAEAAAHAKARHAALLALGGVELLPLEQPADLGAAFLTPGIIDMTGVNAPDEEIFAPLLQVIRVADFDAAIAAANATRYGLAAGLVSADDALWDRFLLESRAGVVNRNRPTTGASGAMPFGGLGASGNHRPSAYYAADYCAYPVASFEAAQVLDLTADIKGLAG
ncbi:succinylglutamate-semialdehyde dehydrogenase [Sphingobium sp. DN12]|uniref:succinylglutamate-semialdehyde dehydrogenase n=1 Tax=Sphingobium sp. DN12 TaxID=3378073 RepID=UPI003DA6633B